MKKQSNSFHIVENRLLLLITFPNIIYLFLYSSTFIVEQYWVSLMIQFILPISVIVFLIWKYLKNNVKSISSLMTYALLLVMEAILLIVKFI